LVLIVGLVVFIGASSPNLFPNGAWISNMTIFKSGALCGLGMIFILYVLHVFFEFRNEATGISTDETISDTQNLRNEEMMRIVGKRQRENIIAKLTVARAAKLGGKNAKSRSEQIKRLFADTDLIGGHDPKSQLIQNAREHTEID